MTTTTSPEGKKQEMWQWIIGVGLIIGGFNGFSKSNFLMGIFLLLAGLLVIPIISKKLKTILPLWNNKKVRIAVPIILVALVAIPDMAKEQQEAEIKAKIEREEQERIEANKTPEERAADAARKREAELEKKKTDFEDNCFSSWDGSCRKLVSYTKKYMKNPKSFEHVNTVYYPSNEYAVVVMTFRGTNDFGAMVTQSVKAKVSYDCEILGIMN